MENLEEQMDPDFGLLDNLLAAGALSKREIYEIKSETNVYKKNRQLLTYIEQKDAYGMLITALKETNQAHLANLLSNNGVYKGEFGDDWPLSKVEEKLLDSNQGKLIDLIEPNELTAQLFSKKVITARQNRVIMSLPNEIEKNERLLDILRRSSRRHYRLFIECFSLTGQSHIADILRNGGVICEVHLEINGKEEELDIREKEIVESFVQLLKEKSNAQQQLIGIIQTGNPDVQLISVRRSNSIAFYFHCVSLDGVMHLIALLSNGKFKSMMERIFTQLLSSDDPVMVTVRWSTEEYQRCREFFSDNRSLISRQNSKFQKASMTSSAGDTSENQSLSEETVCCICTQTYSNPRALPCIHTFCLQCLERYAEGKKAGERISCPVCRKMHKIPVEGILGFARNTLVEKLIELRDVSTDKPKDILCDVCLENDVEDSNESIPVAIKHCIECQQNMRKDCVYHHTRQKLSRHHEVIELNDLEGKALIKFKSTTCDKHPRKPMVLYCLDCQVPMCLNCLTESHKGHASQNVREAAEQIQQDLSNCCDAVAILVEEAEFACKRSPRNLFLERISNVELDIDQRSDKVKKIVDHHRERLNEYLEIVKRKILKEFESDTEELDIHRQELENFLNLARNLKAQGSLSDITSAGPNLLSRAGKLQADHQGLHSRLKAAASCPDAQLIPVDIDDLLSYTTGNLVGKIRVENYGEKKDEAEYYGFDMSNDSDDMYEDCKYVDQPTCNDSPLSGESENQPHKRGESGEETETEEYTCKSEPEYDYTRKETSEATSRRHSSTDSYTSLRDNDEKEDEEPNKEEAEEEKVVEKDDKREKLDVPPYRKVLSKKKKLPAVPPLYSIEKKAPPVPPRYKDLHHTTSETSLSSLNLEIQPTNIVLQQRLRRGKSTEIWLGTMNGDQEVSVKKFTTEAMNEAWIVKSCDFFREANILLQLKHRNIVTLIGMSTLRKPFYVVTEMTSKRYLDHYLKSDIGKSVNFKDIINMAGQIASAMYYLETKNCIHRYLMAKSILVDEDNELLLTNFEMARFLTNTGQPQTSFTDVYEFLESPIKCRAPEVIESQRWSVKSDVWSFGIVVYQLITYGKDPYPEMDDTELMTCILSTYNLPCPAGKNFDYPDKKLLKMMQCCWMKDPFKRPDFKYLNAFFKGFFANCSSSADLMEFSQQLKRVYTLKGKKPVSGVVTCNDEIFISRSQSVNIETYNTSNFRQGKSISISEKHFSLTPWKNKQQLKIPKPIGIDDMSVCVRQLTLYAGDWNDNRIYRINLTSRESVSSWQIEDGEPTGLSVTKDGNVLVSCPVRCKIFEYTSDGQFVLDINFGYFGKGAFDVVQSLTGNLVVIHGNMTRGRTNEVVSVIDIYGKMVKGDNSMELQNPSDLAMDSKGHVYIAERGRNRIILANYNLSINRTLLTLKDNAQCTKIFVNEACGHLYLGLQDGSVHVYDVKSTGFQRSTIALADEDTHRPIFGLNEAFDDGVYEEID